MKEDGTLNAGLLDQVLTIPGWQIKTYMILPHSVLLFDGSSDMLTGSVVTKGQERYDSIIRKKTLIVDVKARYNLGSISRCRFQHVPC